VAEASPVVELCERRGRSAERGHWHLPPPAMHMSAPMQSTWPLKLQQQLAPLQVAGLHEPPPPPEAALDATALDATVLPAAFVLDATVLVVVAPFEAAVEAALVEAVVAPLEAAVDAAAPPLPQS